MSSSQETSRKRPGRGVGIAAMVLAVASALYALLLRLRFDQPVEAELAQQDPVSLFFAFVGWLVIALTLALVTGIVGLVAGCLRAVAWAALAGLIHLAAWLAISPYTLIDLSAKWMEDARSPVLSMFFLLIFWAVIVMPMLGALIGMRR